MRRALALAAIAAITAAAGSAGAESWMKYVDGANGTAWSYDADYTYKDAQSGRVVIMQAISKPDANLGPSAPGKPDGVGSVVAIDCAKKNLVLLGSYAPSKALEIEAGWRRETPKKADGGENAALVAAVCAQADQYPVK